MLPGAHGSALFTRGETQALVVATLGTDQDEPDDRRPGWRVPNTFLLHYNFPVRHRRDGSHGLAERAAKSATAVWPGAPGAAAASKDEFPYTMRVVSEITEVNGSSSMKTVCGGCLALMDAGVATEAPVAGIAMGLIKEGKAASLC